MRAKLRPWWLAAFVVAVTAWRLWAAATLPLTEDEAYYRLWAQRPAFGYFDHPPMIAWWIWAGVRAVGDTPLGVRLLATLATTLTSVAAGFIALRLGGDRRTAYRTIVWHQSTLLIAFGGYLATPDAPATLFWVIATLAAIQAVGGRERHWLLAGLTAGLALLSKYSGFFLPMGLGLWLVCRTDGRRALRTPWPWLGAAIALLVFSPNVMWNAAHGWITFNKQFGRAAFHGASPRHLVEMLVTQGVLLNPLVAAFAVMAGIALVRVRKAPPPELLAPALICLPFAAYLVLHSLHARVEGHWPAPLYPLLVVMAAARAGNTVSPAGRLVRLLVPAMIALAVALTSYVALSPRLGPAAQLALPLRGWPSLASKVESLRRKEGAAWVGTFSYGSVAQLRAAKAIGAPVVQLTERNRYPQDDAPAEVDTRAGLIVDLERRLDVGDLGRCFGSVVLLAPLDRGDPGGPQVRYFAALVARPRRDIRAEGCWTGKAPD